MANLYERLFSPAEDEMHITDKLFVACIVEYMTGNATRTQIVNALNLEGDAVTDFTKVFDKIDGLTGIAEKVQFRLEFEAVCEIAKRKLNYTTRAAFASRLGIT